MTHTITATTPRGAASQIVRAMRREIMRMHGISASEAAEAVYIHDERRGRAIAIVGESFTPYDWTIWATGGADIWAEELGQPISTSIATFQTPQGIGLSAERWMAECENGCVMLIFPW